MKNGMIFILKKLKPYRVSITAAMLLSIVSALALVLLPDQLKKIASYIENGLGGTLRMDDVLPTVLFFLAALLLYFVGNYLQGVLMSNSTQKLGADLRRELDAKINRLPLSYVDRQSEGDLESRTVNDVDSIITNLSGSIASAPSNALILVLCLILMFQTNMIMSIALLLATAVGFLLSALAIRISQPQFSKQQRELGALYGQINETLSGHLVIKAFNCEEEVRESFRKENEELNRSTFLARFLSDLLQPVTAFSSNLSYIAVCITGAFLRVKLGSAFSLGDIAAFILYANLFSSPLSGLMQTASSLQPVVASALRVKEVLDVPEMREDENTHHPAIKGDVTFRHVRFGYVEGQTIIKDLSLEVRKGQKIAIVGKTGAGKSTLVNLLMHFYDVESGEILLDEIPITEMSEEERSRAISMVLQDVWTFEGSIRENILYGKTDVSNEQFEKVLQGTGLSWLIQTLPEGADTILSAQSGISAGQTQLITIARAMIIDAPVLILDEATSNVDTRTEKIIQEAVDRLTSGRTSFVIAHRLSTIRNADQILVMDHGDVVEIGTHTELLKKGQIYAELYRSQFEEERSPNYFFP